MDVRAVVFDLWGTLINVFPKRQYELVLTEMARILSLQRDERFEQAFHNSELWHQRLTGRFRRFDEYLHHCCMELGVHPSSDAVSEATRLRMEFTRNCLAPRPGTLTALATLKSRGYRLGLITNCTSDMPVLWPQSKMAEHIDVAVLSCEAGLRKPDTAIYEHACRQLGVKSNQCLYVGDGSDRELSGARDVGMHPVLLRVSLEDTYDSHRPDVVAWDGPAVTALSQIPEILANTQASNS